MIKSEKGITLIALVITVMVLMIIIAVTIDLGSEGIEDVKNNKVATELSNVQQAIFQQYILLKTYNEDGNIPESVTKDITMADDINRPSQLYGTRIVTAYTLKKYDFTNFKIKYSSTTTFEEYYYILDRDDLKEIGIIEKNVEDEEFSYIVNYSTGEVFDLVNKKYIKEYDSTLEENAALTGTGNSIKVEEQQYNFAD